MINQLKKPIVIVSVTALVPLLNVGEWSTSIQKRIFVLIPERSATLKNGMIPIKSEPLSKEISTTSKTISVLQDAELKMRRLCMLI